MRHKDDTRYSPGIAKAADLTSTDVEREAAASGLIRGEEAREAAKDALIRAIETDDEHDSASELPGEVADGERRMARAWRVARRRLTSNGTDEGEGIAGENENVVDETAETAGPAMEGAPHPVDVTTGPTNGSPIGAASPRPVRVTNTSVPFTRTIGTDPANAAVSRKSGQAAVGTRQGTRPTSSRVTAGPTAMRVSSSGNVTTNVTKGSRVTTKGTPAGSRAQRRTWAKGGAKNVASSGASATERAVAASRAARGTSAAAATGEAAVAAAPVAVVALLLVVLLMAVLSLLAGGAVDEDQRAGAHLVATVAADEYLEGEVRGDYNHKGLEYSAYARGEAGGKDDWSACFVAWCLYRAGFEEAGLAPAYGDVESYLTHFRTEPGLGEVHEGAGERYVPVEGDLFVFYAYDGSTRFGIVTSSNGDTFEAVEGDVAGGPNGTYDRDPEDGHGGYVACTTRYSGLCDFIHPTYSAEAVANRNQ